MNVGGAASMVSAHTAGTLSAKNCASLSAMKLNDDLVAELLSRRSRDDMDCQSCLGFTLHAVMGTEGQTDGQIS